MAVPPAVVTLTLPDFPEATVAVIWVAEFTVNDVAAVPPNDTAVAPVKLVPVIVTCIPLHADAGVNEVMVGAGVFRKVKPDFVAVPYGVITLTSPVVPEATAAVICVSEFTVNELAAVPPKDTAVAPAKFVPVIVTIAPDAADVGVNEEIVGIRDVTLTSNTALSLSDNSL